MDDLLFMQKALDLAARGIGFTSPNPMVGAVVVSNNLIVGEGWHQSAGKAHAEVVAIDNAGFEARNSTLYVNLEPCNHTGRTPPCTDKIIESGLKRVVIAMRDPNPLVTGNGIEKLLNNGIEVTVDICKEEAKKLNEYFIKYIKTTTPYTIVKCAATLDGRIASENGDSKWITGIQSRQYVHEIRHSVDAILVGIGTVEKDNPHLTTRLGNKTGSDPIRIILDSRLSINEDAAVLESSLISKTIIVTGSHVNKEKKARMIEQGIEFIKAPLSNGNIDMAVLNVLLGQRGITSLLIEGGSKIIGSAFASNIVDKICFFYAPKIFGGNSGIPISTGKGCHLMSDCLNVADIKIHQFENDIMIEGYPQY
ncbi:MAG: bifunctional diaminohydroxyphosphoribosylaminopyrimidine deaminase/5-amino-6-(5-phosphoribosylamino)uracil reductase RibD [Deltaproteobacteria bacterium]|jgi:diaminohydroxyphosphoribosylaminopyrimidine deaminase / 5-amino-6-(5-phosphoribosylamino)uracil reductase|nr:bifunctional diaminohydroxyphosphoribosylaminopyrimidine deaminase/5-amino-6-(5-phosphoribosylamino)uracil reductase RibD [Deltaproteobacteria bacterium]MBT4527243.1 bifunctional diaminohydroxyphosphoribosylaminopyrimidine deaminase/5-amino-6-(5-phosphoribosylamino)uracil reductase RibD [Deltaproteobacteria bacterium]